MKNVDMDEVFDIWYNIERGVKGPWYKYEAITSKARKFTDATMPDNRMILWFNNRPKQESHDLLPVMDKIFMEFKRLTELYPVG